MGVEQFRNDLLQIVSTQISPHVYEQELYYDSEILLGQTNLALVDMLAQLEPFGASNPSPILRINKCYMRNLRKLNGGHLKGELESISGFASFIGFRMELPDDLVACALDVLAVVEKNEWQGRVSVQLRLIDYKKSP